MDAVRSHAQERHRRAFDAQQRRHAVPHRDGKNLIPPTRDDALISQRLQRRSQRVRALIRGIQLPRETHRPARVSLERPRPARAQQLVREPRLKRAHGVTVDDERHVFGVVRGGDFVTRVHARL